MGVGDRGVVTPEGVPLELDAAGVGTRALAFALDVLVQFASLAALGVAGGLAAVGAGARLPSGLAIAVVLLGVFAVFWGYPVAWETLARGRTPGKAALGLRVVTVEGAPVAFRHAALRASLGLVDFWLTSGAAALLSALVTPRHQRLGDLVAGTLVLRERSGATPPRPASFAVPPDAEAYAAALDVSALSSRDYAAVRAFLLRAPQIAPDVRADLARRLAAPLCTRIAPPPPPDMDPQVLLATVAARYQQRGNKIGDTWRSPRP